MATERQEGSLADFDFDNESNEWFGQGASGGETSATEKVVKQVKTGGDEDEEIDIDDEDEGGSTKLNDDKEAAKDEDTQAQPAKKKEATATATNEEEEPQFFVEEKETGNKTKEKAGEEGQEERTANSTDEQGDKFYTTLATEMKEKGIFQNVEIPENEELDEEKFIELQDKEIEARVDETVEALFENLDEDAKAFIKFKKNGGRTEDFILSRTQVFPVDELDGNNPEHQAQAISYYLKTIKKMDSDEIADTLQGYKDAGKTKAYFDKYSAAIKEYQENQKKLVDEQAEKDAEAREKNAQKFNKDLEEVLLKTEAVGNFPISKQEQKELNGYITRPTVKVGKNRYVPPFQAAIAEIFRAETPEAKQKLILIAKLVRNDFDTSDIATKAETKVIKKAKDTLKAAKEGSLAGKGSGAVRKKELSDYDF